MPWKKDLKKILKDKNKIHPYEKKLIEEEKRFLKNENKQMMYLAYEFCFINKNK